jgi:hypothetical protein
LIPKKDRIYKDKIIEQAFEKDYKKHRDIQFVSLNPKKGWSIMNLFKDDPIINNCTLAAITEKEVAFFKHDISAWFFYEEENPDKEFTEEEEFDIDALGGPAQNEGFELQNVISFICFIFVLERFRKTNSCYLGEAFNT